MTTEPDDGDEIKLERILDHRQINGRIEYFVQLENKPTEVVNGLKSPISMTPTLSIVTGPRYMTTRTNKR